MAYTPTVWETGDVITAEKLNKAEQGIADNSPLVVTFTIDQGTMTSDTDYSVAMAAIEANRPVVFRIDSGVGYSMVYLNRYVKDAEGVSGSISLAGLPQVTSTKVSIGTITWTNDAITPGENSYSPGSQ